MATQVKVCGITRPQDAKKALALGADYIGLIVYPKSPRAVEEERLEELLQVIPKGKRVLVDVATPPSQFEEYLALGFDFYQIHFDLDISMASVAAWSEMAGPGGLWVAPRMPAGEVHFPQILMEFSDTIVLDAYSRTAYGGTGKAGQNWQRYLDCSVLYQHKRWILAGGLAPDNVIDALRFTQAETIDVNSGVESAPGIKDGQLLKKLFSRVREYDCEQSNT